MIERTNLEWWEALQGEPSAEAIADLYAFLLRGLRYGLAHRRDVTDADLEDFAQDALVKVLRNLNSFRGESRFTTWAQKIAMRTAFTELRRRRWQDVSLQDLLAPYEDSDYTPEALLGDHLADPAKVAIRQSMVVTVQRIIAEELTDKQRLALSAIMVGGMNMQEVAVRMGTNRNALYKLIHDGRKRLQARLVREGLTAEEILAAFEDG
jgi:RNA polymerase sigma-70 factor (ECF subfamily)